MLPQWLHLNTLWQLLDGKMVVNSYFPTKSQTIKHLFFFFTVYCKHIQLGVEKV